MPYTLWSRGILIGATDFTLGERGGRHLAGVFQPTENGLMLLPVLTAMGPARQEVETLELHTPDGEMVVFESVLVSDLLEMKRFGFRTTPLGQRRRTHDGPVDPIRYLISVTLAPPDGILFA